MVAQTIELTVTVKLTAATVERLRAEAERQQTPFEEVLEAAIETYLLDDEEAYEDTPDEKILEDFRQAWHEAMTGQTRPIEELFTEMDAEIEEDADEIRTTSRFDREIKLLRRKYPSVRTVLQELSEQIQSDERPGDKIPNVGYDVHKVRLKNPSAERGKSGGFRVIYYIRLADHVILLTIYSKSQQSDIAPEQLRRIIEEYVPPTESE